MKTSELIGAALDWAVAKADGAIVTLDASIPSYPLLVIPGDEDKVDDSYLGYTPSTDWAQGGPIIEREKIGVQPDGHDGEYGWVARKWHAKNHMKADLPCTYGPTPLIAAMRCFVASKLGAEVDIPEELT